MAGAVRLRIDGLRNNDLRHRSAEQSVAVELLLELAPLLRLK